MRAAAAALVACIPLAIPSTALADDAAARGRFCDRALAETDLPRAFLAADECLRGDPGQRRARVEAARDRALAGLREGAFAPVDLEVTPPGATVTVAALGADGFAAPRTVWLPLGTHEIRAAAPGHQGGSVTVSITSTHPGPPLRLTLAPAVAPPPGQHEVDFGEEGAAGDVESASDLPQAKHDELLKDKYRKGLAATGGLVQEAPPPRFGVGVRAGTGVLLTRDASAGPSPATAWLLRAGAKARYRMTDLASLQLEPALQLLVADDSLISLSLPLLVGIHALRVGPALNLYRDDRTHAELAGVLAVTAFGHWDLRLEAGLTEVGDGARTFAFILQWDSRL